MLRAQSYTQVLLQSRIVGGGLPAMNDDAIFLVYRVIVHRGQAPSHSPVFAARQG